MRDLIETFGRVAELARRYPGAFFEAERLLDCLRNCYRREPRSFSQADIDQIREWRGFFPDRRPELVVGCEMCHETGEEDGKTCRSCGGWGVEEVSQAELDARLAHEERMAELDADIRECALENGWYEVGPGEWRQRMVIPIQLD